MEINIFEHKVIYPFAKYGLIGTAWGLNISTIIYTWCVIGIFCILAGLIQLFKNHNKRLSFILPAKELIDFFKNNIEGNLGYLDQSVFEFILPMFLFVLICNLIGLLPFLEEPTADINTALAIGVSCFCFIQWKGLQAKGFGYFKKFFSPVFILFPLNVISQTSKVVSLSFRLFGNILAGSIILSLLKLSIGNIGLSYLLLNTAAMIIIFLNFKFNLSSKNKFFFYLTSAASCIFYFIPLLQGFFGLFEGAIQALVVALLTSMYVASEMSSEGGH